MKKLLGIVVLGLLLSGNAYADEMPEKARPNDATISLFEWLKKSHIENRRRQGRLYIIEPKGNAVNFKYKKTN